MGGNITGTLSIRVRVAPDVSDKETTQRFVSMKKGIPTILLKIVIPDEFVIEGIGEGQYTENGENTKPDCMMPNVQWPGPRNPARPPTWVAVWISPWNGVWT